MNLDTLNLDTLLSSKTEFWYLDSNHINDSLPRGVVVSALTSHVRGARFDSRPG